MSNKSKKPHATISPRVSIRDRAGRGKSDNIDVRIKRLMEFLDENTTEFAARLGVRERSVYYWIDPKDDRTPLGKNLDKIEKLEQKQGLKQER